jgi:hypothetical protein
MIHLVLTGSYAGQTIILHGVQFLRGEVRLDDRQQSKAAVLRKYFGAVDGKRDISASDAGSVSQKQAVQRGVEPRGSRIGSIPADDGSTATEAGDRSVRVETDRNGLQNSGNVPEKEGSVTSDDLVNAIRTMDVDDDSLWTETAGKPAVLHLSKALGLPGLTRGLIDEMAPGITREYVRSIQADEKS